MWSFFFSIQHLKNSKNLEILDATCKGKLRNFTEQHFLSQVVHKFHIYKFHKFQKRNRQIVLQIETKLV